MSVGVNETGDHGFAAGVEHRYPCGDRDLAGQADCRDLCVLDDDRGSVEHPALVVHGE
jgi:hypothetical protein